MDRQEIINKFNNAVKEQQKYQGSYSKVNIPCNNLSGTEDNGETVKFNQHLFDQTTIKIYQEEIKRLEQENKELKAYDNARQDVLRECMNTFIELKNMLPEECFNENQCNFCPHHNADLCTCKIAKKISEVLK